MTDWNSGPTYTLGPFSAAGGSPLGGFLAGIQGLSQQFAAGNAVATGSSSTAVAGVLGTATPAQLTQAYQSGVMLQSSYTPFQSVGSTIGNVFGTGVGTVGGIIGQAGSQAAAGVAGGASAAGAGVGTVASAGALGGLSGTLKGALSGIGVGLNSGAAGGATGGPETTLLYVAGGILLLALFLVLT